jgi:hypothetical protein
MSAGQCTLNCFSLFLLDTSLTLGRTNIHHLKCVENYLAFHSLVYVRIGCETWALINLKEIGLQLVVEHNVNTQNLKTHLTCEVVGLAAAVCMGDTGLYCAKGFNHHVINLAPEASRIVATLFQIVHSPR